MILPEQNEEFSHSSCTREGATEVRYKDIKLELEVKY